MARMLTSGWIISKTPRHIPRYWRNIAPGPGIVNYVQRRDWQLVLNAAVIPYRLAGDKWPLRLYVPPLYTKFAQSELQRFTEENAPVKPHALWVSRLENAYRTLWVFAFLFLIYAFDNGWLVIPDWLPGKKVWTQAGALDNFAVIYKMEYERIFTALTLHKDLSHLAGNFLFGAIFLFILARFTGWGRALLISIIGGALGNLLSAIIHLPGYRSIGFSTAIFAALGGVSGIICTTGGSTKKIILSLGSGLGLLALLGMEGENTDWAAHLLGLGCGLFMGFIYGILQIKKIKLPGQSLCAILVLLIFICAWICAFQKFAA